MISTDSSLVKIGSHPGAAENFVEEPRDDHYNLIYQYTFLDTACNKELTTASAIPQQITEKRVANTYRLFSYNA